MIDPDALVEPRANVSDSARIWGLAHIREGAVVGDGCVVGRGAYVDAGVIVAGNCKIQNDALIYAPARIEEGVFIGPSAVLANDPFPRAVNPDGSLKGDSDWEMRGVTVRRGASIGAGAVVLGGVEIGEWALVGAGAVVTKDVSAYSLVVGNPARWMSWVGPRGVPLEARDGLWVDALTGEEFRQEGERLMPA